jgi:hypothetical protein
MSSGDDGALKMPGQHPAYRAGPRASTSAWSRLGRAAGYFAGGAFLAQTVLYLLDVTGAITQQTMYQATERGWQQDLIDYYVSYNERMHKIWWDVALHDVLGPLGYLALIVLVLALLHVAGTGKPREELGQLFVVLGASTAGLSDLMYLSQITWWRRGGFQATPDIIAYGRAFEIVDNMGNYLLWAGCLVLALGFICLGPTLSGASLRRRWLSVLAYLEAAALLAYVFTHMADADVAGYVAAVASGLVIGPALAILMGHALAADRIRPITGEMGQIE